jgi:pantoate--beta-alanine ligase
MKIIRSKHQIRELLKYHRLQNKKIAFVPTMGALHEGHISLIKKAKSLAEIVVVSIFVNKTQFNNDEDFTKYPRNIEQDILKLTDCKYDVDYVFTPDDGEIFPINSRFKITPLAYADCLCGLSRSNHFEGVALIIVKLFNIIQPDFAIFGEKDFQQLLIIKKLVEDLNFDVEIYGSETLRLDNGLAISSRNQRLNQSQIRIAGEIFRILNDIKNNFDLDKEILVKKTQELLAIGFQKVDYLEIRDEQNLKLINDFQINNPARIFVAVYLGGVRLIDNLKII